MSTHDLHNLRGFADFCTAYKQHVSAISTSDKHRRMIGRIATSIARGERVVIATYRNRGGRLAQEIIDELRARAATFDRPI